MHKPKSPDRPKFNERPRGKYFVAAIPEQTARFIARELVAELRRSRPDATLTEIGGEYGESERSFRRYLNGNAMPLGKARRFASRLRDLHFASVTKLERIARSHPRGHEAAEPLQSARRAFEHGYPALNTVLLEHEEIVQADRAAVKFRLDRNNAESEVQRHERTRLRYEQLRSALVLHEEVIRGGVAAVV
ncbi:MAG: hypothetical protein WAO95_18460 [Burkholderiales bacterium]